jgi:hypothetical protein
MKPVADKRTIGPRGRLVSDLALHALGFVARVDGQVDDAARSQFRRFVRARRGAASVAEMARALDEALALYRAGDMLMVCSAQPCAGAFGFDTSDRAAVEIASRVAMPVMRTGCQGQCKHKPVVSLRVGEQTEMFGRLTTNRCRGAVFDYAKAAHALESFVVPGSNVDAFRLDREHGSFEPAACLEYINFLSGRFRGEGRYADGTYKFTKEVVGTYEAGGRCVALRMVARYPTSGGRHDLHRALVVVGLASECDDKLVGRAFTDGGDMVDYEVECRDACLEFDDRSPDHGTAWKRVRKVLRPTRAGYEEWLYVDRGDGLEPYYRVDMQRAAVGS